MKITVHIAFKCLNSILYDAHVQKKDGSESTSKVKPKTGGGLGLLPPPPGGSKLPAPPGSSPSGSPAHVPKTEGSESWGEFTSAQSKYVLSQFNNLNSFNLKMFFQSPTSTFSISQQQLGAVLNVHNKVDILRFYLIIMKIIGIVIVVNHFRITILKAPSWLKNVHHFLHIRRHSVCLKGNLEDQS